VSEDLNVLIWAAALTSTSACLARCATSRLVLASGVHLE
jgi:hypothetical protein